MKNHSGTVRLLLPPASASLPRARREELAQLVGCALSAAAEIVVAESYEQLTRRLLSGEADLAWAPPLICARFETIDIPVLMRAVRRGEATYRAALVCGAGTGRLSLDALEGRRMAWVDRDSCAGYLLPGAWLRSRGDVPTFGSEVFYGTYTRALSAVLKGEADVSSVYCACSEQQPDFNRLIPNSGRRLMVLGLTDDVPNDGVVVGPYADKSLAKDLELALLHPSCLPDGARVLESVFGTSTFEAAPRHGYRALYSLLSGRSERAAS